jgi:[ribosomal protein S5]-alanine N-acetyltransferase
MDLISDRLIYTKFTEEEYPNYLKWYTSDEIMHYIAGRGLTVEEAEKRFENALLVNNRHEEAGLFVVKDRQTHTFVGIAKFVYVNDIQVEVGYGMLPQFWGKGYATEMLVCMIEHAQTVPQIKELVAIVNPSNLSSRKVLLKQKFEFVGQYLEGNQEVDFFKLILKKA